MNETMLNVMMEWLSNLQEQGFSHGDLSTLGDWAGLDNKQKMFMAFQQIHLLKEKVTSMHTTLECTQELLLS